MLKVIGLGDRYQIIREDGTEATIPLNVSYLHKIDEEYASLILVEFTEIQGMATESFKYDAIEIDGATFSDLDSAIDALGNVIAGGSSADALELKVVTELPTIGSTKIIYLLKTEGNYEQFVYQDSQWIKTGEMSTTVYQGKDAITIAKLQPTDTATTVSLKIDDNDKFLAQSTSGLSSNVDLRYEKESGGTDESGQTIYNHFLRLYGKDSGTPVTEIDINDLYKDNYLVSATYDDAKQALILTFKIDNHYQNVEVPIPTAYEGKEAIKIEKVAGDSAFTVSLIVDNSSVSGLTQSNSGIKLVADDAINSASTNVVQNKKVYEALDAIHIVSGETADGKTYKLNVLGVDKAETINVPNGSNVTALTVDDASQSIKLDIKQADGTTSTLSGDATNVIFEDDVKNGLEVDNHNIKVKIDATSDSGLTVSSGGVKMNADAVIDSASTNAIENKEVYRNFDEIHITSAETTSSTTYTLNVMGVDKDVKVEVANDQYVSAITIDNANQQIILDKVNADGTVTQLSGDATNIIFEDDIQDGLKVVNHEVYIDLVDDEQILTVDANGLKDNARLSGYTDANNADHIVLSGFSEIIDDVKIDAYSGLSAINIDNKEVELKIKDGEKILKQDDEALSSVVTFSAVTSIDNGVVDHTLHLKGIEGVEIDSATTKFTEGQNITLKLTQGSENDITISGKNYTIIDAPISAVTGKDDVLYLLKEYDDETSAYTYSQFAWIDDDWEQVSALGEGVEYVAGKNIDIYEDATTHKQTISGSQVVELTQAQYDALATKDPDKLYVITDADGVFKVVNELPTQGLDGILYLLNKTTYYEGYFYVNNAWMPMNEDLSDVTLNAGDY